MGREGSGIFQQHLSIVCLCSSLFVFPLSLLFFLIHFCLLLFSWASVARLENVECESGIGMQCIFGQAKEGGAGAKKKSEKKNKKTERDREKESAAVLPVYPGLV